MPQLLSDVLARLPSRGTELANWRMRKEYLEDFYNKKGINAPEKRKALTDYYIGDQPTEKKEVSGWVDGTWERTKLQTQLLGSQMREYWNAQTKIGDFDEEDYEAAKKQSSALIKELQSLPQDEGVLKWTQDFISNMPTLIGNLGVTVGVGWGGAKVGAAGGVALAPFLGPAAPIAPLIGGTVGFASGILAGMGLDAYMEGSVAFSDAERNAEVAERVRAKYGNNPELIEQATRGVALEVADNVLKKNLLNPANALVAVPFLKAPGKLGKSFLFRKGGLKQPNKLARTRATVAGASGEAVQEATQEGIQEWELKNALNQMDDELGRERKKQSTWERVEDLDWDRMLYAGSLGAFGGGVFAGVQSHLQQSKEGAKEQVRRHVREAIESGDPTAFEEMRKTYLDLEQKARDHVDSTETVGERKEAQKQLNVITNARKTAFQEIEDIQDGIITDPRIDKDKTRYRMRVELLAAVQGGPKDIEAWVNKHKESNNPLAQKVVENFLETERAKNLDAVQGDLLERMVGARAQEIERFEAETPKRPLESRLNVEAPPQVGMRDVLESAISEKISRGRGLDPEEIAYLNRTERERSKLKRKSEFKPLEFKRETIETDETVLEKAPTPKRKAAKKEKAGVKTEAVKKADTSAYSGDVRNVEVLARKVVKGAEKGEAYAMTEAESDLRKNFPNEYETAVQARYDRFAGVPAKKAQKPAEEAVAEKAVEPVKKEKKQEKQAEAVTEQKEEKKPETKAEETPTPSDPNQPTKEPAPSVATPKKKTLPTPISERTDDEIIEKGTVKEIKTVIEKRRGTELTAKERRMRKSELQEMARNAKEEPKKRDLEEKIAATTDAVVEGLFTQTLSLLKKMPQDRRVATKKATKKATKEAPAKKPAKKRLKKKSVRDKEKQAEAKEEAIAVTSAQPTPVSDKDKSEYELMQDARELFGEPSIARMSSDEMREMVHFALRDDKHDEHLKGLSQQERDDHEIRFSTALSEVIEVLPAYSVMLPYKGERTANIDSALKRAGKQLLMPSEVKIWMSIAGENLRGESAMLTDLDGMVFHPIIRTTGNRSRAYIVRDRHGNPAIDFIEYQSDIEAGRIENGSKPSEKHWVKVSPTFVENFRIYAADPKSIVKLKDGGYTQVPSAELDNVKGAELNEKGLPTVIDEVILNVEVHETAVTSPPEQMGKGDKKERSKAFESLAAFHFAHGDVASRDAFTSKVDRIERGVWDSTQLELPNLGEATSPDRSAVIGGEIQEEITIPKGVENLKRTFDPQVKGKLKLRSRISKMGQSLPNVTTPDMTKMSEDELIRTYLGMFINSQREGTDILTKSDLEEIPITELRKTAIALKEDADSLVSKKSESDVTQGDVDSAVAEFLARGGSVQKIETREIGTTPTVKETFETKQEAVSEFIEMVTDGRLESAWVSPDADGNPVVNAIFKGDEKTKPYARIRFKDTSYESLLAFLDGVDPDTKDRLKESPLFKLGKTPKKGLTYQEARLAIDSFRREFGGSRTVNYRLFASPEDAPAWWGIDKRAKGATLHMEDGFGNPTIAVFHNRLGSLKEARALLFHESIVHHGMREVMGTGNFNRMISDIIKHRYQDVRKKAEGIGLGREVRPFDMRIAAEEMLADLAEGRANATITSKVLNSIRAFISKVFGRRMTDSQMMELVIKAEKKYREGRGTAVFTPARTFLTSQRDGGTVNENTPAEIKRIRYSLSDELPHLTSRREEVDSDLSRAPKWMNEEQKKFYMKMGPPHKGNALTEKLETLREDLWTKIRQGVFDRYASVLERAGEKAYVLSRMASSSEGAFSALFSSGGIRLDDDGAVNIDEKGISLSEALKPLGGEMDTFLRWVGAKRAASLKAEGRDSLRFLTDEEVAAGLTLNEGTTKNAVTGVATSRAELFEEAHRNLNRVQGSVLDIAEKTGVISKKMRDQWEGQFYVPFYRVMEGKEGHNGPMTVDKMVNLDPIKRLEGSDRGLGDLLQNTMLNLHHLIDASLKNQAAKETVKSLERQNLALKLGAYPKDKQAVIEFKKRIKDGEVEAARELLESDAQTIYVREDGERVYYRVYDPLVLESLLSMNSVRRDNPLFKFFRGSKRWFTHAVTLSPQFRIANLMRDTISTMALSPVSSGDLMKFNPIFNVVKGYKGAGEKSEVYGSALAGGGMFRFGHSLGTDPDRAKLLIKSGIKREFVLDNPEGVSNFRKAIKDSLKKGYQWYEGVGDRVESANRVALYKHLREKGKSHLEASYEARDLMDFSLHGSWGAIQTLADWSPFLNARLQGLYKLGRAGFTPGRRTQFATVTMGYVMASLLNYLAYMDDDDFKEREEWDRDTYHWFKIGDTAFRIPKAFEIGAIATLAERVLEQMVDNEASGKLFRERLWHTIHETFAIDPIPLPLRPMLEIYSNRNPFTDRPIESVAMKNRSPEERKNAYTSETATLLSRLNAEVVPWDRGQFSPVQIEHAVKGYTAWVGTTILGGVDSVIRMAEGNERPEDGINNIPLVGGALQKTARRFVVDLDDKRHTKYMTMFYDQMKEMNQVFSDIREMRRLGDIERAKDKIEKNKMLLRYRTSYNRLSRRMTKINHVIKRITNDPKMSGEMKRQRLNRLQQLKNQLARVLVSRATPSLNL